MTHCRTSLEEGLDVLSVNDDDDKTHWQYDDEQNSAEHLVTLCQGCYKESVSV